MCGLQKLINFKYNYFFILATHNYNKNLFIFSGEVKDIIDPPYFYFKASL